MANRTGFPLHLLNQPVQHRISYFRNFTLVHPHLGQTYEDLFHAIKYSTPGSLIFLYGPSGVGKTTLIQKIYKEIFDDAFLEMIANPTKLPAIMIRAIAADGNAFDWKDFFRRLLVEASDFVSERRIDDEIWENIARQNNKIIKDSRAPSSSRRKAVENCFKHRAPLAVLIDEAQEIGAVASGRKLLRQTNVLKSIAEETRINHILSGTYELLPLRNLNGQLSRRSIEIHFPRYDAHCSEQSKIFRNVLRTLQVHLPLEESPNLIVHWEYLFERSVGCVGTVKDWLTRSLSWALEKNQATLTLTDLKKREPSVAQSARSLEEILEGERKLKTEKEEVAQLRVKLGLDV